MLVARICGFVKAAIYRGNMKRGGKLFFVSLILLAFATLLIAPFVGITHLDFSNIFTAGSNSSFIFLNLRLPRVLFAFLAGSGLAIAGAVFQALFRNPLASPFTLGVLAGGSFGAAFAIIILGEIAKQTIILGFSALTAFAFLGCMLDVFLVYFLSRSRRKITVARLLLAGVVLNFFFAALVQLLIYIADPAQNFELSRFMLGYLGTSGFGAVLKVLPLWLIGIFVAFMLREELNLFKLGEEFALSKGVNVERIKILSFLAMSVMTAGIVSLSGPILFVGLMTPHIVRLFTGDNQGRVLFGSLFAGGILLVLCDTFARSILPVGELPVGVVTSMLGGPFFLIILVAKYK